MQVDPTVQSDAPAWLVDLVMTPPWWALLALVVATLVCVGLAARRVYREDLYISLADQRDMLLIVGTAEAIAVGVVGAMGLAGLSYLPAVGVGVVSGFAAVEVARRLDVLLPGALAAERAQVALAWTVVAIGAFAFPRLVAVGDTAVPQGIDIAIGTVAVGMLFWTVMQEWGPGETVGDVVREGAADD